MSATIRRPWQVGALFLALSATSITTAHGQTTAFTYQGQLSDAGAPANANYDLRFALFDSAMGGTQIGTNQTVPAVQVSNGLFTVQLDFGVNAFPGANRFVEIGVSPAGGGSFTTLAPRQQISSSPYSIRTLSAATADALSSACVGCVTNAQINSVAGTKVTGTIPAASVPSGSGNYVQNTTTQQANANFNIAGNGVVGGDLTIAGTLNANVGGNFIQNRTTPQTGANFNVGGNGTIGDLLTAGRAGIGTSVPPEKLTVQTPTNSYGFIHTDGTVTAGSYVGTSTGGAWYGTKSDHPLSFFVNDGGPIMTIATSGRLGIGTTTPASTLDVRGTLTLDPGGDPLLFTSIANSEQNRYIRLLNSPTFNSGSGLKAGGILVADDYGFANPGKNDLIVKGKVSANDLSANSLSNATDLFLNASTGRIALRTSGVAERVTILENGNVGIGTTSPGDSFTVGNRLFSVDDTGLVSIGRLPPSQSTSHVCIRQAFLGDPGGFLADCASAAEYAPSIDGGVGFPETGDLVSIAPAVKNPYGDTHGPFTVEKSATACDANLLGFVLNPESGADNKKLNDHYLPLAIYGYFPAKVTLENGAIHRGDPITSSSKPGYGMRATQACKVVGYALEDADREGTIQVFAHLTEFTAPQVAQLQTQVAALQSENAAAKDRQLQELQLQELQDRVQQLERQLQTN